MSARHFSRTIANGVTDFFGILGSAIAVSEATRLRRRARDADLQRLGIDPDQFRRIGRF